ncbi:MAG TPA: hypothetical protein VFA51_14935 [Candidatus Udaeobacter sp.]|nr:hypothetical protein [Candidatus Udaeobacter sp.]
MKATIRLPQYIFEQNMPGLLRRLGEANKAAEIYIDFKNVTYFTPGAIVAVTANVYGWHANGKKLFFVNHTRCTAFKYLQRINFFDKVGLKLPEEFIRKADSKDFIPLQELSPRTQDIAPIATRMAACIAPKHIDEEVFKLLQYASSEAMLNCKQHSRGRGFVAAQYAQKHDFARIAVADCGRGILASFRENESPHYREGMTDRDGLELALQPNVSSTTHLARTPYSAGSPNFGVGLNMLRALMEASIGYMFLASGTSWFLQNGTNPGVIRIVKPEFSFQGTICAVAFQRGQVDDFQRMLAEARAGLGLRINKQASKIFA